MRHISESAAVSVRASTSTIVDDRAEARRATSHGIAPLRTERGSCDPAIWRPPRPESYTSGALLDVCNILRVSSPAHNTEFGHCRLSDLVINRFFLAVHELIKKLP